MERTELINLVKTRLDEVSSSDSLLVDVGIEDNKPLDTLIDSLLNEAAQEVYLKAPSYRLKTTKGVVTVTDPINEIQVSLAPDTASGTGMITIPFDRFGRFISLKMSDWRTPATKVSLPGDEIAKMQIYEGVKGTPSRPVVVMSRAGNEIKLQYYSSKAEVHSISELLFIRKELPETIKDNILINAMLWICAGKVNGVLNNANAVQICNGNAQSLLV